MEEQGRASVNEPKQHRQKQDHASGLTPAEITD